MSFFVIAEKLFTSQTSFKQSMQKVIMGGSIVLHLHVEDKVQELLIETMKIEHFHLLMLMQHDDAFNL